MVLADSPVRTVGQPQETNRGFHILTLGCSKNRVDSDGMEHLLLARGMTPVNRPDDARVVIVNTCGFLGAARDESVAAISELLEQRGQDQLVIAAGCMPALGDYRNDIPTGVDHVMTTREWHRIGDVVGELLGEEILPEVAGCEGMLTTFSRAQAGPSQPHSSRRYRTSARISVGERVSPQAGIHALRPRMAPPPWMPSNNVSSGRWESSARSKSRAGCTGRRNVALKPSPRPAGPWQGAHDFK